MESLITQLNRLNEQSEKNKRLNRFDLYNTNTHACSEFISLFLSGYYCRKTMELVPIQKRVQHEYLDVCRVFSVPVDSNFK